MRVIDPKLVMNTRAMAKLERVEKIVVHTEGQVIRYKVGATESIKVNSPEGLDPKRLIFPADVDAEELNYWAIHGLGWSGIAYHMVALNHRHSKYPDGTLMLGRPVEYQGAHVEGLNNRSLGICAIGNGEFEDFTDAQKAAIAWQCANWVREYRLEVSDVIGHRETKGLVKPEQATTKTCPGTLVDMNEIRLMVEGYLDSPPAPVEAKNLARAIVEQRWRLRDTVTVDDLATSCETILEVVNDLDDREHGGLEVLRHTMEEVVRFYD